MSDSTYTNSEAINITLESIQKAIAESFALPKDFFSEKENTDTLGMIQAKMSLQVIPLNPMWLVPIITAEPPMSESEKFVHELKCWAWVNKFRRRNLACKVRDYP